MLITFIALSLMVSVVSVTITRAGIFEPIRLWAIDHNAWLAKLLQCPYCLSHWGSLAMTLIYQVRVVNLWLPLDLIVTALTMVAVCAFIAGAINKIWEFDPDTETIKYAINALEEAKKQIQSLNKYIKERLNG